MEKCHLDYETRAVLDLEEVGMARMLTDPHFRPTCACYNFDGSDEIAEWVMGEPVPPVLVRHAAKGGIFGAHNAAFERGVWNRAWGPVAGGYLEAKQMDCTMARAQAFSLPAGLDNLAKALALSVNKDMEGNKLMKKMMRPSGWDGDTPLWLEDAVSLRREVKYCSQDVVVEKEADIALPPLSAVERQVWLMDQRINDRGIPVDVDLVRRAQAVAEIAVAYAEQDLSALTGGVVTKPTQHARMGKLLADLGLDVSNGVGKDAIGAIKDQAEAMGLQWVLDAIQVKADAAKSSLAKFHTILASHVKGRIYGSFVYHTATTGRWGSRLVQVHNLPRIDSEEDEAVVADVILILQEHNAEDAHLIIDMTYGKVLKWLSLSLRGMIYANAEVFA